jgi:hypothetical protein
VTFQLFFSASATQAAIIFFTSADVRHGLVRMVSPKKSARKIPEFRECVDTGAQFGEAGKLLCRKHHAFARVCRGACF